MIQSFEEDATKALFVLTAKSVISPYQAYDIFKISQMLKLIKFGQTV